MKKQGFTLVELLAVVVIIGITSILMVPKILERFENKKIEISEEAKKILYIAADQYMKLNSNASNTCITIGDLIESGQLVEPVLDIKTNTSIPNTVGISIEFYNEQYNYKINEEGCEFNITYELTNATPNTEINKIKKNEKKEIVFTSKQGYSLPNNIDVTGADYIWDKNTGKLLIENVFDNVKVSITSVTAPFDSEKPTLTVSTNRTLCSSLTQVIIKAKDNGASGLSGSNKYMYYLSTSNKELVNGSWNEYKSNEPFSFSTDKDKYTPGTYYLWVYPIIDNYGNVNDNYQIDVPYVIETLTLEYEICYNFTGNYQNFIVPHNGNYEFHAWGSQGAGGYAGLGGYTKGNINLAKQEQFYIYVGGTNGYNGGGNGCKTDYTGGGSTDIRYFGIEPSESDLLWNSTLGLNSRIMVAAGGGGNEHSTVGAVGHGGGLTGITGVPGPDSSHSSYTSTGGTQTSGGVVTNYGSSYSVGTNGSFGQGGTGGCDSNCSEVYCGGSYGGGGGYYGGAGGSRLTKGRWSGGGGSSYISGHNGCVAVTSSSSSTPKSGCVNGTTDITCSYHYSNKIFTNTQIINGNQYMLLTTSATNVGIGNRGNGFVRIKHIID